MIIEKIITQAGPGAGMGNLHADARSNSFNFSVIPFDYRGEKIKAIKIIGGNQEHFSYYVNNHSGKKLLAINFDAEKAKVIDWVDTAFPFLDGSYKVKKWLELTETGVGQWWTPSEDFSFQINDLYDNSWYERPRNWELELGITRKKLAVDAFSPTIKTIKLIFSNQEELKEYVKQVKEKWKNDTTKEFIIQEIDWNNVLLKEGGEDLWLKNFGELEEIKKISDTNPTTPLKPSRESPYSTPTISDDEDSERENGNGSHTSSRRSSVSKTDPKPTGDNNFSSLGKNILIGLAIVTAVGGGLAFFCHKKKKK